MLLSRSPYCLLSASVVAAVVACAGPAPVSGAEADSTFAEKRASREPWEYVVSFPGDVVDLALDIPFEMVKESVEFVYERRLIERIRDFLTAADGSWGVVPVVKPRGDGGLKYFHRNIGSSGSKLTVHAVAGLYNRQSYGVEIKRLSLVGGAVSAGFDVAYDFMSDEQFFGLGPVTDPDDESNYAHELARADVRIGHTWDDGRGVYTGISLGIDHNNILDGRGDNTPSTLEQPAGEFLAGAGEQVRMGVVGADASVDTRDFPGSPTRGWLASAGAEWYREVDDDIYAFWKFRADLETHVHIAYRRVLDLRVAGEFTPRQGGRATPFYYLSSLGRYETIRGFSNGRLRDANAVLASVEYRWPVRRGTDATLFIDAGNVYDHPGNFRSSHVSVGWGGGFRVYNRNDVIATVQAGRSREEWRLYFVLN